MQKKLTIKGTLLIILNLIVLTSMAQKSKKATGESQKFNPKFSYSPPERSGIASTGITIALLQPIFLDKEIEKAGSPWSEMAKAMANDIEELLTAKGFRVRGPFASIDEMVYSDKQNSDFIIQITIDMVIKNDRKFKTGMSVMPSALWYRVEEGKVTANSTLILTALSCFTSEKLWKKNLDMPQKDFTYVGNTKWAGDPSFITEFKQENNLYNPVCKYLEEIYIKYFETLFRQFDKDEMANVSKEAKKSDGSRRN